MAKKQRFKELDIVVLVDDRIFQVMEVKAPGGGMAIRWLDGDNESYIFDSDLLKVKEIISHDPIASLVFLAARSIHLRLNSLSKV